mmetsp:Transcript_26514/g.48686  ORF Transcript_26514/g.48686 Transcript_26514/m.48686 type:complete len:369 (+) Transcript_26514:2848-3954(+)
MKPKSNPSIRVCPFTNSKQCKQHQDLWYYSRSSKGISIHSLPVQFNSWPPSNQGANNLSESKNLDRLEGKAVSRSTLTPWSLFSPSHDDERYYNRTESSAPYDDWGDDVEDAMTWGDEEERREAEEEVRGNGGLFKEILSGNRTELSLLNKLFGSRLLGGTQQRNRRLASDSGSDFPIERSYDGRRDPIGGRERSYRGEGVGEWGTMRKRNGFIDGHTYGYDYYDNNAYDINDGRNSYYGPDLGPLRRTRNIFSRGKRERGWIDLTGLLPGFNKYSTHSRMLSQSKLFHDLSLVIRTAGEIAIFSAFVMMFLLTFAKERIFYRKIPPNNAGPRSINTGRLHMSTNEDQSTKKDTLNLDLDAFFSRFIS